MRTIQKLIRRDDPYYNDERADAVHIGDRCGRCRCTKFAVFPSIMSSEPAAKSPSFISSAG
jgi:hypothetical protein